MKFLIDTNRYTDFAKGDSATVEVFANARRIYVPFVTVAELRAGFRCGTIARKNEAALVSFLANDRVEVLQSDDGTTQVYAELFGLLRARGTPIPTNDLWIAALAVEHSLPLYSRDAHFDVLTQIPRIQSP